jgi:hypothetical protein
VSSAVVSWLRTLTVKILQLPVFRSFLSCEYPAPELSQFPQLRSTGLGFSLYSLGADPAENTISNNHSIVVYAGLPIRKLETGCNTVGLLLRTCMYSNICSLQSHRLAAGLYATVCTYQITQRHIPEDSNFQTVPDNHKMSL